MSKINFGGDSVKDLIDNAGKPAIAEGNYLAVVTKIEDKLNDVTGSFGFNITFQVNSNPESIEDGWDTDARLQEIKNYTFVGYRKNGKLELSPYTRIGKVFKALNLSQDMDTNDAIGSQVKVSIVHTPSQDDLVAIENDPTHTPEQFFAKINYINPYILDGVKAPRLAGFESVEEVFETEEAEPTAPAKKAKKTAEVVTDDEF